MRWYLRNDGWVVRRTVMVAPRFAQNVFARSDSDAAIHSRVGISGTYSHLRVHMWIATMPSASRNDVCGYLYALHLCDIHASLSVNSTKQSTCRSHIIRYTSLRWNERAKREQNGFIVSVHCEERKWLCHFSAG